MQALTTAVQTRFPGVTIYGISDAAHQLRPSDHNEDDTPGSRPAQSDADNVPEHRAIDVMVGPAMSHAQCQQLVDDVVADPVDRARLRYINYGNRQWHRRNNWQPVDNSDDPHPGHAHFSGDQADDENGAGWPSVTRNLGVDDMFCAKGDLNDKVLDLQITLVDHGIWIGPPNATDRSQPYNYCDSHYGDWTARGLREFLADPNNNGERFGPWEHRVAVKRDAAQYGASTPGEKGDKGDPGLTPTKVALEISGVAVPADVIEYAP